MKISPTSNLYYSPKFSSKLYFNNLEVSSPRFFEDERLCNNLLRGFDFYNSLKIYSDLHKSFSNIIKRVNYLLNDGKNVVYQIKENIASVPVQANSGSCSRKTIFSYDLLEFETGKFISTREWGERMNYREFEKFLDDLTPDLKEIK